MNILQRRLAKGWTQEDLARHSGLSTRTIQRIEAGYSVGLESQKCIAAVFEVSTNSLIQDKIMNEQKIEEQPEFINKEQQAIKFSQTIMNGPQKGQKDPLMKIERDAINKVKAFYKNVTS